MSTVVLPHLTYDWEMGMREAVCRRLNFVLKAVALLMLGGGVCVLVLAPAIFGVAFQGKYDGGLAVLPMTLTYCTFHGIAIVAMTYLWCAERGGLSVVPMGAALIVNTALNLLLVPRLGLAGAVMGTTAGNVVCLAVALFLSHRVGMRFDAGTLVLCGLPLALVGGAEVATLVLVGALAAALFSNVIFSEREKRQLDDVVQATLARLARKASVTESPIRRAPPS
jgi:O-antigen/teichoic acid export membrane protein